MTIPIMRHQPSVGFASGPERPVADSVGHGSIALFVHGLGEGRYHWRQILDEPRMQGRRISYDLVGHGDAPHLKDGRYSLAKYTEDLLALLDLFPRVPIVLVGHSMGGEIALRAAACLRHDVRAIILVDCGLRREPMIARRLTKEIETTEEGFASRDDFIRWLIAYRPLVTKEVRQMIAQEALQSDPTGGFKLKRDSNVFHARLNEKDSEEGGWVALSALQCPILILRGEASSFLSDATARAMAQHAQSAMVKTVRRTGHGIALENPAGFVDAIVPFLNANLWTDVNMLRVRE